MHQKFYLNLKKRFDFLFLIPIILGLNFGAFSQTITYPVAAEPITRGYGQSKVTWQVAFPSACNKFRINLNLGQSENIEQLETIYVPGSFTATNANGSPLTGAVVTESNTSDLDSVFFDITGVTTGQIIKFTAIRKANCGIAQSTKDAIYVYGLDGSNNPITTGPCYFFENDENNNNYNLLAPAFTIVPTASLNNVSLNQTYIRNFDLINGGNGCANKAGIWIKYGAGEAQLVSLKIGATALTPVFTNGDSTYFEISGVNLTSDQLFCNGEKITFTETVKILKCNALTTYGSSWNDHAGIACSKVTATTALVMNSAVPNLVTTTINPNFNNCFRGETTAQTIKITNSGLSGASKIFVSIDNLFPGSYFTRQSLDTTVVMNVKNSAGLIIGTLKNFKNVVARAAFCGASAPRVQTATAEIVSNTGTPFLLSAGDFITIDIQQKNDDVSKCNCAVGAGWSGFRSQLTYKNECETANYLSPFVSHAPSNTTYFQSVLEYPTDLAPNDPFKVKVNLTLWRTYNKPDGTGKSTLVIPLKNTGINLQAGVSSIPYTPYNSNATINLPVAVVNDSLKITLPQNYNWSSSFIDIPLIATCDGPNLPMDKNIYGGTKNLQLFVLNQYAPCAPIEKMGCYPIITTLHCPGNCPKGGATPLKFSLNRTTVGLADNDDNHLPDATGTLDYSKIDLKRSVNGDTLKGTWNAVVYPNVDPTDANFGKIIEYVYVDFYLGAGYPTAFPYLTALPNATIKIYPNRNKNAIPITCTASPVIINKRAHYEFDQSCRNGDWSNDSLVIEADYVVNDFNGANANANGTGPDLFVTSIEMYSSYVQKLTPNTAPIDNQTYTCDHFNDANLISRIWLSDYIYPSQTINGCTNTIESYMRQYVRNQEGPVIFPYEYRVFNTFNKMTVTIPPGYTYRAGTAKVTVSENQIPAITNRLFSDNLVSQSGNKLIFDISALYVANGGFIVPPDEVTNLKVSFSLDPTCEAATGIYPSNTLTTVNGNGINTPLATYNYYNNIGVSQTIGYQVTTPIPFLAGGGEVLSPDNSATWDIAVQNLSNTVAINNGYLFIEPKNSLTNIIVKEGATVLSPDPVSGIYKLGNIAAGANRPITISAIGGKCADDSLKVNFGFDCNGYPTSPSIASCTKSKWLKIIHQKSQIQLTVEKQPDALKDLCTQDFVQYKISSALAANVVNPRFGVIPPAGLIIDYAQMEYPAGSGNWVTVVPDFNPVTGITSYQVNPDPAIAGTGHPAAPIYGLPGTLTDASPEGRSAQLRVYYTTSCDFVSGSKISVRQRGTRPCGDFIPASLGNNGIVRSNAININGAAPIGTVDVKNVLNPTALNCNAPTTISGTLTPVGTTTEMSDSLQVTLPSGINYVGNYSGALTLVSGYPKAGLAGTTIVRWALPAGTVSGTALNYQFDVNASPTSGCGQFNILSEVSRSIAPLVCGSGICPRPGKAIIGGSETIVSVNRPEISFGTIVQTNEAITIPGNTIVLEIPVSNSSSTAAPASSLVIEFYCGSSATPFTSQPYSNTVPANGSTTASVSVTIPLGSTCQMGEPLRMVIKPTESSCICNQTEKSIDTKVIYNIKGNVFRDANGLIGTPFNTVDGTPTNVNNQIYAHLLAADGIAILETVPVGVDGKYEFIGKSPAIYSVQISKSPTDATAGLPVAWTNTGEHIGIGSGSDGTVDGKSVPFTISNADIVQVNFGVEQPPLALDRNEPPQVNPGGSAQVMVPSLSGTDPEDGPQGSGSTFTIETLPTNAQLFYKGALVTIGQVIGNFNPADLTVDPNDGAITVSFKYTVTDAAGLKSPQAIINIPFTTLEISGRVYNDVNGLNPTPVNKIDGTPTNVTSQLFAQLIAEDGITVLATTPILADGTYKFSGLMPGDYMVYINNNPLPSNTTTLPSGWVNTGEFIGTNAGSDITVDGKSAKIVLVTSNQPNVNFGIEQPPTPIGGIAGSVLNPEGVVQSADAKSLFTGTDPSGGTIVSITLTSFPTGATSIVVGGVNYLPTDPIWPANGGTGLVLPTNPSGTPLATITADPTADGATEVVFTFINRDNAGVVSPTSATVTLPFSSKPLPVTLISFNGTQFEESINLNWKTANEKNFSHFEIEKSYNAVEFASIGKVISSEVNIYNFTDSNPNNNENYYRLKMVDIDGTFTRSNIVSVNYEKGGIFVSVENPAINGEFRVSTNIRNPNFIMHTISGAKVDFIITEVGRNQYALKIKSNTIGIYMLSLSADGKLFYKKVLMQ